MTVKGGAAPANEQVFILWNALDGQRLATTTANGGGDFSATVTVPEVAPGVCFMVIAGEDLSEGVARMAFEVTPGAGGPVLQPASELATVPAESRDSGVALGFTLLAVGLVALFSGSPSPPCAGAGSRPPARASKQLVSSRSLLGGR